VGVNGNVITISFSIGIGDLAVIKIKSATAFGNFGIEQVRVGGIIVFRIDSNGTGADGGAVSMNPGFKLVIIAAG
jgi:hypothetical protein